MQDFFTSIKNLKGVEMPNISNIFILLIKKCQTHFAVLVFFSKFEILLHHETNSGLPHFCEFADFRYFHCY